jgi:hypothetical protein
LLREAETVEEFTLEDRFFPGVMQCDVFSVTRGVGGVRLFL